MSDKKNAIELIHFYANHPTDQISIVTSDEICNDQVNKERGCCARLSWQVI